MTERTRSTGEAAPGNASSASARPNRWARRAARFRPYLTELREHGPGWQKPHGHIADTARTVARPMSAARRRAARSKRGRS